MSAAWAIVRNEDDSDSYRCLHDEQGRYVIDVHALVTETTEHLDERARLVVAALNAVRGIPLEDLERINALEPYLRLLKLSYLSDRQAATMEGAPADPYVALAGATGSVSASRPIPTGNDLARAVKLFHGPGRWTAEKQAEWNRVTGQKDETDEAMSAVLLTMADAVLESEIRIDLGPLEQGAKP